MEGYYNINLEMEGEKATSSVQVQHSNPIPKTKEEKKQSNKKAFISGLPPTEPSRERLNNVISPGHHAGERKKSQTTALEEEGDKKSRTSL